MNNNFKFTNGWISGFIQADGCFTVTFEKKKTGLLIKPRPIFVLTQDISEENLFKEIHKWLGIGFIVKRKENITLTIKSLSEFKDILFPILDKYPLKYGKLNSYLIFKSIVNRMLCKEHLTLKGLIEIISLGFQLNKDTTKRTEKSKERLLQYLTKKYGEISLPNIVIESPKKLKESLDLDFLTGLIDGDGSFNVSFQIKPYRRIKVNFTIVQETSCKELLNEVKNFFNCGQIFDLPSKASRFQIEDFKLITSRVEPVLSKVFFNTQKNKHYKIAIKVSNILNEEPNVSTDTFKKIVELSYDSNKLGKRRTISKEEIIKKLDQ